MNNNQTIKVLLATPSYDGRFDVRFITSLIYTIEECKKLNIEVLPYFLCYDSLIQRARNDYFKIAYKSKVDVLFFIDSDIGWEPKDFIKLVLSDKDMIGGAYRKKTDNEELYAFKALEKCFDKNSYDLSPDHMGILEVYGLGCGFLKLSKKCVTELWENEKEFYFEKVDNGTDPNDEIIKNVCACIINEDNFFVSEDIILGRKWRKLGNKLYLDTNINCSHVGYKQFDGNVRKWIDDWRIKLMNPNDSESTLSKYFDNSKSDSGQEKNQDFIDEDPFKVL
jgi:hypothetical protein